jgi:hypothetical protein
MAPGTNVLVTNIDKMVGDYTNPILKPQAAEAVKKFGEIELGGMAAPNPTNQCWPEPGPYILRSMGIQMLQQPGKITILYYANNKFRQIRLNEPHPARVTPSWKGDSVGHYEGDTLVIDTVGVKTDRPFAMIDCMARRTPRLCTWWSVIGCLITRKQKKRKNAVGWRIFGSREQVKAGPPTPTTGARDCNSN